MGLLKCIVLGFIAGAIATLTAHEFISEVFATYWTGWDRVSWDMSPIANPVTNALVTDFAPPKIVSATFWGGVWGSIFGVILGSRPQGSMTLKGALLGIVLPAIVGVFILVPLITGRFGLFFDGDISKIVPVLGILAGYGAVTAWLYGMFQYGRLP